MDNKHDNLHKSFKMETHRPRPLMLKDYLMRDDLSSCSSNGFKSFPRRQCCTTVRFLLEIDLKTTPTNPKRKPPIRKQASRRASHSTVASALQQASVRFINAVKLLPFHSVSSPSTGPPLLPQSLSRKLLRRSFWKRKPERDYTPEVGQWRTFRELLQEKEAPACASTVAARDVVPSGIPPANDANGVSTSSSSDRRNSSSWDSSDFSAELARSASDDESSRSEVAPVPAGAESGGKVSEKVGVTDGKGSIAPRSATTTCSKQEWPNEEKEQFSPVSVLDCPFKDDEDISSPFDWSPSHYGGTKQKLAHKTRRCEGLSQLEPVQLEKRIALLELEDGIPLRYSSSNRSTFAEDQEEDGEIVKQTKQLLDSLKCVNLSFSPTADILLSDFFRERLEEEEDSTGNLIIRGLDKFQDELLTVAKDWISSKTQELLSGWEVEDERKVYIRDMERGGRWRDGNEEKVEVGLELETEVWTSLMDEVLLDILS